MRKSRKYWTCFHGRKPITEYSFLSETKKEAVRLCRWYCTDDNDQSFKPDVRRVVITEINK